MLRIPHAPASSLVEELVRPKVVNKAVSAINSYSSGRVAELLNYSPDEEYRLPAIPQVNQSQNKFNPYFAYYQIMAMHESEFSARFGVGDVITPQEVLTKRKEVIEQLCREHGEVEPKGYGFKRLKREIEEVSAPLIQTLKNRVPGGVIDVVYDQIAQRYSPDSTAPMLKAIQDLSLVFQELYTRSRRYGILMPKDQQMLTFFSQIAERVFSDTRDPLNMFIVACPRYGEHDEYDRLEEGLSQTADTYLHALPLLTTVLQKYSIPYRGYILVNDTEEFLADGSLLERLGLNVETYRAKCRGNVDAISQAINEDERINGISAQLLTEVFPEFIEVTANLERQLYKLTQNDTNLRLEMARVADARLNRHIKIMGGECDFSDSMYLALHYSAEYMALGYLCRLYPNLSKNSFIVNYNSPNVEQFNSQELLAKCMKGTILSDRVNTIPVFQVKYY